MIEYLIRKNKTDEYMVSKWDGSDFPSAVYTVRRTNRGLSCNCQSRSTGECKHVEMVKAKIKEKDENVV